MRQSRIFGNFWPIWRNQLQQWSWIRLVSLGKINDDPGEIHETSVEQAISVYVIGAFRPRSSPSAFHRLTDCGTNLRFRNCLFNKQCHFAHVYCSEDLVQWFISCGFARRVTDSRNHNWEATSPQVSSCAKIAGPNLTKQSSSLLCGKLAMHQPAVYGWYAFHPLDCRFYYRHLQGI